MKKAKYMRSICVVIDVLALLCGALYIYFVFRSSDVQDVIEDFFITINPMTYGSYFLGIVLIFHCYVFKNIWGRLVFWGLYLFSATLSLVAIMGVSAWSDFLMYVPHLFIITVTIFIMHGRKSE